MGLGIMNKARVLFVDDDPELLAAYQRKFRKIYHVATALGPDEGLVALRGGPPVAAVVSDLRMPGMDGVRFLDRARELSPDTSRIMLSGFADADAALAAVNTSKVHAFLTKPCPEDTLAAVLAEAVDRHRLIEAERDVLHGTVRGAVKLLTDLLAMVNPEAFGKSSRVTRLALDMAAYMGLSDTWVIEMAGLLSQIGCAALPQQSLRKAYRGEALGGEMAYHFAMHPRIAADLLDNIPRLSEVARAVAYQDKRHDGGGLPPDEVMGEAIPLAARILKAALDYDTLLAWHEARGKIQDGDIRAVLTRMRGRRGWYDPAVLDALESMTATPDGFEPAHLAVCDLKPGMILDQEVRDPSGDLILAKGGELSMLSIRRLRLALAASGGAALTRVLVPPREKLEFTALIGE